MCISSGPWLCIDSLWSFLIISICLILLNFLFGLMMPWQVKLEAHVDPDDVSFSWTWSVPGASLEESAQGGRTDLEYLVILPAGLQMTTEFTVTVTMTSLAHPDQKATLQADVSVHTGLVALPGGLQVRLTPSRRNSVVLVPLYETDHSIGRLQGTFISDSETEKLHQSLTR